MVSWETAKAWASVKPRRSMLAVGMLVRMKDFSQSAVLGPRMLPSIQARPGQRVQLPRCEQELQVVRCLPRMARTSLNCGEFFQMSEKFCSRTLPQVSGNCTQG